MIYLIIIQVLLASIAQIFFKKGVSGLGDVSFSLSGFWHLVIKIFQNGWLIIGIFLFGVSFLIYLVALSRFQLNIIYPIFVSAGIILIAIFSWFLFKESLSLVQIAGIVIVIFGIFLLSKT